MNKIVLPIVLVAAIVAVFLVGSSFFRGNRPDFIKVPNQEGHQKEFKGENRSGAFYEKDGLSLTHTWPGEGNFSNEETEILIFNESNSTVEVKTFDLTYQVEDKAHPHKSGTWEKFPTGTSWEKIEYLNIGQGYYQGQLLVLSPGQKGKLHWHIAFGEKPLDGHQAVKIRLVLSKDGEVINVNEEFNRDSGTVFSKGNH